MTTIMSDAPTTGMAGASKGYVISQADSIVRPKAIGTPDIPMIRAGICFLLMFLSMGFAENLPLVALLLAALALIVRPREQAGRTTTGGSCSSSMPDVSTPTPSCLTERWNSTEVSPAMGYREPLEAMNMSHSTGGDAR